MNIAKTYAERIATDYAPKETSDLKALKKLDKKAKQMANFVSYTHGIVCTLLLGVGMCFSLNIIGGGTALFLANSCKTNACGFAFITAVSNPLPRVPCQTALLSDRTLHSTPFQTAILKLNIKNRDIWMRCAKTCFERATQCTKRTRLNWQSALTRQVAK